MTYKDLQKVILFALLLFSYIYINSCNDHKNFEDEDVFVTTKEWQVVPKVTIVDKKKLNDRYLNYFSNFCEDMALSHAEKFKVCATRRKDRPASGFHQSFISIGQKIEISFIFHSVFFVYNGQKIPKGLHVRINFETGVTEAKLLDNEIDENKVTSLLAIEQSDSEEGDLENWDLPTYLTKISEVLEKTEEKLKENADQSSEDAEDEDLDRNDYLKKISDKLQRAIENLKQSGIGSHSVEQLHHITETLKYFDPKQNDLDMKLYLKTLSKNLKNAAEEIRNHPAMSKHDSMEALKKYKHFIMKDENKKQRSEKREEKKKFMSYDELKKSMDELNLMPKTDSEILKGLIIRHKAVMKHDESEDELLKIIEDLDFLAHQYDNALEFIRQNGLEELIYANFNSTRAQIRKETLKLLGSLVQNNSGPKIHALETGIVRILLRFINADPDLEVRARALSTLSVLLRSFPVAQKKFVENGGFGVISQIFAGDNTKLKVKVVTLISDLIIEQESASSDENLSEYYSVVDIKKHTLENNFCQVLSDLISILVSDGASDHDSIEKCLIAMSTLKDHCGGTYPRDLLNNFEQQYVQLSSSKDDFFFSLHSIVVDILLRIPPLQKSEL